MGDPGLKEDAFDVEQETFGKIELVVVVPEDSGDRSKALQKFENRSTRDVACVDDGVGPIQSITEQNDERVGASIGQMGVGEHQNSHDRTIRRRGRRRGGRHG